MTQDNKRVEERLDTVIELLQRLLALELSRSGVPYKQIGKDIRVATAKVVQILHGVPKNKKV